MFGRSPRLPVDLMFDLGNEEQSVNYPDYVKKWKRDMQEAYALAVLEIIFLYSEDICPFKSSFWSDI